MCEILEYDTWAWIVNVNKDLYCGPFPTRDDARKELIAKRLKEGNKYKNSNVKKVAVTVWEN